MSQDKRILELEQQLQLLQQEVASLREKAPRPAPARQLSRRWMVYGLGLVMGMGAMGLLTTTQSAAQGPSAKAHTIKAPFHVVDKAGQTILSVEESFGGQRGLFVHNSQGKDMVWVVSSSTGNGGVYTKDSSGGKTATLGGKIGGLALEGGGEIVFVKGDKTKCQMALQGMVVYGDGDKPIATFGADPKGKSGLMAIGQDGKQFAALNVIEDVGTVTVNDANNVLGVQLGKAGAVVLHNGQAVGKLGLSPSGTGAGYLALANAGGSAVVEGGMLQDGRGVVRAYPYDPSVGDILAGSNLIVGRKK